MVKKRFRNLPNEGSIPSRSTLILTETLKKELQMQSLYIFLDEGGNFDFSAKGSQYFTITSITRERPFNAYTELTELKYDVLETGLDIEYFHATEDRQVVRDGVFGVIGKHLGDIRIDSIVAEKRKAHPSIQVAHHFYCRILGYLLRYVLNGHTLSKYSEIIIITDKLPHKRERGAFEKAVKQTISHYLPSTIKYRILHHDSKSNFYLQIADYCNWAIGRKWERSDNRSYDLIRKGIKSEFEVFRQGKVFYY